MLIAFSLQNKRTGLAFLSYYGELEHRKLLNITTGAAI